METKIKKQHPFIEKLHSVDVKEKLLASLPTFINVDRFTQSAAIAWYKNPKLQECSIPSLLEAIYTGAQLGLDFIFTKGHAYLVPFKGKAVFVPGYRGFIDLAVRHKIATDIQSRVVYENEERDFEVYYGTNPYINHKVLTIGARGEIFGAYAVAFLLSGGAKIEFMHLDDLGKIRKESKQPDGDAYTNWIEEMYRKAPIRRIFKQLPSNEHIEVALAADNEAYEIKADYSIYEGGPPTPGEQTKTAINNLRKERKTSADMGGGEEPQTAAPESKTGDDGAAFPPSELNEQQIMQVTKWLAEMSLDLTKAASLIGMPMPPNRIDEFTIEAYDRLKIKFNEHLEAEANKKGRK